MNRGEARGILGRPSVRALLSTAAGGAISFTLMACYGSAPCDYPGCGGGGGASSSSSGSGSGSDAGKDGSSSDGGGKDGSSSDGGESDGGGKDGGDGGGMQDAALDVALGVRQGG